MDSTDPRTVAETYFRAWKARDFAGLRAILADDVGFQGPLATLDNADDCVKGLEGMAQILDDIVVQHVFVDGPDLLVNEIGRYSGTVALDVVPGEAALMQVSGDGNWTFTPR